MSASSVQNRAAFEGLRWCQVEGLLEVLRDTELRYEHHIRRRFNERASGYARTAAFLREIGVVGFDGSRIMCRRRIPGESGGLVNLIIGHVLRARGRYRAAIFRYLRRFRCARGEVVYRAGASARARDSAVRNFLMDLGIVRHRVQDDAYALDPAFVPLFVESRRVTGGTAPGRVTSQREAREEIGLAAELAVVAYERDRIGPEFADRIDHVSQRNASAGYDVLSARVASNRASNRYIEVKAVPSSSMRFYWTGNEVNVAGILRDFYYLYLVPVEAGVVRIDRMTVIADPVSVVLDSRDWVVEPHVRLCRLSERMDGGSE